MGMIALVTGASSGFGQMIARELADAGMTSYASMQSLESGDGRKAVADIDEARQSGLDLRPVALDVQDEASCEAAVGKIVDEHGRIDVLVHNAGHMVFGACEAFTPAQLAESYDVNVVGTQRVNRAVLPHMRRARQGLVIWISSSSVAGGVPPLLGPYFAAKAGMDALAVCYAKELAPFGVETAIVVPGAYTKGTNHFPNAGHPKDENRASEYEAGWPDDFADRVQTALAATDPPDSDPSEIGRRVAAIVASPRGRRPFRTVIDPADDGSAVSFPVIDRVRSEFLHRIGFPELSAAQ